MPFFLFPYQTEPLFQLVVKVKSGVIANKSVSELKHLSFLSEPVMSQDIGGRFNRVFSDSVIDDGVAITPSTLDDKARQRKRLHDQMRRFYSFNGTKQFLSPIAESLRASDKFEAVTLRPIPAPASAKVSPTPNFLPRQGYVFNAPQGCAFDTLWAQNIKGQGVRVVDVEGDWNLSHEDLPVVSRIGSGLYSDKEESRLWWNHGTAVIGMLGAPHDGIGVNGIAPLAKYYVASIADTAWGPGAISAATVSLEPGDVMVIELQGREREDPIERTEDWFTAIKDATLKGIIVVEAAGNGGRNLDSPEYDNPGTGFGNPFRRNPDLDSGAILVGAGSPPSASATIDRSRLDFSCYGSCVDAQGWGMSVVTLGYGDLFGSPNVTDNSLYSAQFNGTSSATPQVAGAAILVQSFLKSKNKAPLTSFEMRKILRETGSQQQGDRSQNIGNRPIAADLLSTASKLRRLTYP